LDLNDNEQLDSGEPSQVADSTGLYRFDNLLPQEYVVRQVLPDGWEQPTEGAFFVDVKARSVVGLGFPSRKVDFAPIANNDVARGIAGEDVIVNVLENDSDPEGSLDTNSIRLTSLPRNGQALISNGSVVYRANVQFSGTDSLTYTVEDQTGKQSNVATVSIEVSNAKPWQNPSDPRDVDADGFVIPRDVLALVSDINTNGSRSLANVARSTDSPYLDVNGDDFLSPRDVLLVVSFLNQLTASGEPPTPHQVAADFVFSTFLDADDDETEIVEF